MFVVFISIQRAEGTHITAMAANATASIDVAEIKHRGSQSGSRKRDACERTWMRRTRTCRELRSRLRRRHGWSLQPMTCRLLECMGDLEHAPVVAVPANDL
jgi:hypothetical protein